MSPIAQLCVVDGCINPSRPDAMKCWTHSKRIVRKSESGVPVRHKRDFVQQILDAALEYANVDAEDDAAFYRARRKLLRLYRRPVSSRGGRLKL